MYWFFVIVKFHLDRFKKNSTVRYGKGKSVTLSLLFL